MLATAAPVPFDFLINGSFLRSTIQEYMAANGIQAETTLTLQYVRATLPPSREARA
jgi:ribosome biogenesis protein